MDVWRWVESDSADGATQMATDWAILENAKDVGIPTVRVYRWNPYCISLGYHQSVESIDLNKCQDGGVDVVRRPTGGRAVFHAEEITYSVVIPEGSSEYSESVGDVYHFISRGLVRGIWKFGVPGELQRRSPDLRTHYQTPLSVSCFSAAAKYEVVVGGKKLVGSAQRRVSGGVLQHGSILTGDAHLTLPVYVVGVGAEERKRMRRVMEEKTVSIGGYLGKKVDYREMIEAIRRGMEEEVSVAFEKSGLTQNEEKRAHDLWKRFSIFSS